MPGESMETQLTVRLGMGGTVTASGRVRCEASAREWYSAGKWLSGLQAVQARFPWSIQLGLGPAHFACPHLGPL